MNAGLSPELAACTIQNQFGGFLVVLALIALLVVAIASLPSEPPRNDSRN